MHATEILPSLKEGITPQCIILAMPLAPVLDNLLFRLGLLIRLGLKFSTLTGALTCQKTVTDMMILIPMTIQLHITRSTRNERWKGSVMYSANCYSTGTTCQTIHYLSVHYPNSTDNLRLKCK
jgi:hypothetical protein